MLYPDREVGKRIKDLSMSKLNDMLYENFYRSWPNFNLKRLWHDIENIGKGLIFSSVRFQILIMLKSPGSLQMPWHLSTESSNHSDLAQIQPHKEDEITTNFNSLKEFLPQALVAANDFFSEETKGIKKQNKFATAKYFHVRIHAKPFNRLDNSD